MTAPESILTKIKLLLSLSKSPNQNEAANALEMVDKLIVKYNISPEELKSIEEKKPLYDENDKLFTTIGLVGWRQQLAVAIGKHFECKIIQEELIPFEGLHQFDYYVYGDSQDANNVRFVFNSFIGSIEKLMEKKCPGRGQIYLSSYGEGVVEAIKNNIYWDGIELPTEKVPSRSIPQEEKILNNGVSNLSKAKEEKEKPTEQSIDISSQSFIKDVMAYFAGLNDGKNLALSDILELEVENEKSKELTNGNV
jgi:hypothetical protein